MEKEIKKFYDIIKKLRPLINSKPSGNNSKAELEARIIYNSLGEGRPLFSKEFIAHLMPLMDDTVFKEDFINLLFFISVKGEISGKSHDYTEFSQDLTNIIFYIRKLSLVGKTK